METVELAYDEFGSQNSVPLIILHGFFASSRNWRKIAETLSATYHVYVLDMRNHGNSPHHEIMDYPTMTTDVLRFMDEHMLNTAHIIGHSMGGKIAMWLALNHPEKVNRLIVVDIAPVSYAHNFDKTIQALIDLPLAKIHNRKEAEVMLVLDIPEADYRQFLLQNLIFRNGCYNWRINLAVFFKMAHNIVAFPLTEGLMPYDGKTLFVAGANSEYVTLAKAVRLFPDTELSMIANAGHWVHAQQPEAFLEAVENFLQRGKN